MKGEKLRQQDFSKKEKSNPLLPLMILFVILLLDLLSKKWVVQNLPLSGPYFWMFPFGGIPVFQCLGIDCCIHYVSNYGAAWGLGSHFQTQIVILRFIIVFFLLKSLYTSSKLPKYYIPLALIAAGGVGNILDYFLYGHVVDMIHLIFWGYSYPVFNVADAAIVIGVMWIAVLQIQSSRKYDISSSK
ncbi:signal peptidase II [Rhabdochlamydiaceae symbiont of Dictyostelium giganteum]|uniref:signal peptidase II n=1 Tax=Rhabdochlamydiaceae symbiont of Dictyostelium giganteum TaxID=3342349 RepID=UPI00384B79F8